MGSDLNVNARFQFLFIENHLSVTIHTKMKYLPVFILGVFFAVATASPLSEKDKNETTCLVCKAFIGQIGDLIVDPSNEQAVADTLKQICDVLFPDNVDQQNNCKNTIDNSLPAIIEAIISNYVDPEALCTTFGACPLDLSNEI